MFRLLIIRMFCVFGVKAIINPYGPTVVSDLTSCLSNLIEFNFNKTGLLVFANTNNVSTSVVRIRSELLKSVNKNIKYAVEILSPNHEVAICDQEEDNETLSSLHFDKFSDVPPADYFVIVVDSYKDFSYLAGKLIRSRNWNPRAKFIILFFSLTKEDVINISHAEKIITCLYRFNVINIVVAIPQSKNVRDATVYGWRPYDPPNYCGYFNETATNRLIVENVCVQGNIKYNKNIFEDKVPVNMKGCIIEIIALERLPYASSNESESNIEQKFVNELFERFNLKPKYKFLQSYRGEKEDVGVWNGALKQLVSKKGYVLLGGIFPDDVVHEDFDYSSAYLSDSYTWIVPRANHSPPWIALIIIFNRTVWYSAICGFIICSVFWKIMGTISKESFYHRKLSHCSINTWICMFGFCAYNRPKKNSLRVFFVFLNIYCIMFLTGYQTKLFNVLTNPTFEHQMATVEELVESNIKFGGSEELHDIFFNSTDPMDNYIGEQWIDVIDQVQALIDVSVNRNFSLLCSRLELAYISSLVPELSDKYGNFKYYAFKDNVFSVPIEMVSLRGFPLMPKFTLSLGLLKQLGANVGVRQKFAAFNLQRRANLLDTLMTKEEEIAPLSVFHLEGGFLVLALGYISGSVVLIFEIILDSNYVKGKISKFTKKNIRYVD